MSTELTMVLAIWPKAIQARFRGCSHRGLARVRSRNPTAAATGQTRGLPPRSQGTRPTTMAADVKTRPTDRSEGAGASCSPARVSWCCPPPGVPVRRVRRRRRMISPRNAKIGGELQGHGPVRHCRIVVVDVGETIARVVPVQQSTVVEDGNALTTEGDAHPIEDLELGCVVRLPQDTWKPWEPDLAGKPAAALREDLRGEAIVPFRVPRRQLPSRGGGKLGRGPEVVQQRGERAAVDEGSRGEETTVRPQPVIRKMPAPSRAHPARPDHAGDVG